VSPLFTIRDSHEGGHGVNIAHDAQDSIMVGLEIGMQNSPTSAVEIGN